MLAGEHPCAELGVRPAVAREPRDLSLQGGELLAGLDAALADTLARGEQLALGPPGERLNTHWCDSSSAVRSCSRASAVAIALPRAWLLGEHVAAGRYCPGRSPDCRVRSVPAPARRWSRARRAAHRMPGRVRCGGGETATRSSSPGNDYRGRTACSPIWKGNWDCPRPVGPVRAHPFGAALGRKSRRPIGGRSVGAFPASHGSVA